MSWVLEGAPGTERLPEYEARLNDFYLSNRALGLCQYNRNSLPPAMLDHCLATHPYVRIEDQILLENPFYEKPERAMHRQADSDGVRDKLRHIEHTKF